jgi:hypothetical protein
VRCYSLNARYTLVSAASRGREIPHLTGATRSTAPVRRVKHPVLVHHLDQQVDHIRSFHVQVSIICYRPWRTCLS